MITREKAIEVLEKAKGLDDQFYAYTPIHYLESIDMAIEVLKAQETPIERVASDYGLKVDGVRFALEQYQTVICEITRSRMSKLSYYAKDIIQLANEMMCEGCELQEAQEPQVLSVEAVRKLTRFPVWLDVKSTHKALYRGWVLAYMVQKGMGITGERLGMADPSGRMHWYKLDDYGRTWRVWDSIPTDTEKEAIPW